MAESIAPPDPAFQALVREKFAADPPGMTELGARLLVGREAPHAPADGAALIEEAAGRGDARAWSYMALVAATGVGRAQSWPDALAALQRAADLGEADAARQLALLRECGVADVGGLKAWLAPPPGRVLNAAPPFRAYEGFLSPAVCGYFIERARPKLTPARVNDAKGGGLKLDAMRTSTGAVFSLIETDFVMQLVRARIAAAAGVAWNALEPLEVLHYEIGQTYKPHIDFFHPKLPTFREEMRVKGQRIRTCLVYLNDDFEAGETEFPKLGLKFRGRVGEALVFDNVGANGIGDLSTVHAGLPPTRGEKWLLSQWIRSKPQRVV